VTLPVAVLPLLVVAVFPLLVVLALLGVAVFPLLAVVLLLLAVVLLVVARPAVSPQPDILHRDSGTDKWTTTCPCG